MQINSWKQGLKEALKDKIFLNDLNSITKRCDSFGICHDFETTDHSGLKGLMGRLDTVYMPIY